MNQIKKYLFNRYVVLILALVSIYFGTWLYKSSFIQIDKEKLKSEIENYLEEAEKKRAVYLEEIRSLINDNPEGDLFNSGNYLIDKLAKDDDISLLVYEKEELKFWTNNSVAPAYEDIIHFTNGDPVKLKSGWYVGTTKKINKSNIVLILSCIKQEYNNRNRYLTNSFSKGLVLPEEAELTNDEENSTIVFKKKNQDFSFGLVLPEKNNFSGSSLNFIAIVLITGLILLVLFLKEECVNLEKYIGPFYSTILLVVSLFALRYWSLVMEFPAALYEYELFKPSLFAASFLLPSLGDFLINSLLILYVFYFLDSRSKAFIYNIKDIQFAKYGITIFILGITLTYAWYIGVLLKILIEDSNIEFNINNIFNLSVYSFVGFLIIGFLFFSFYLLSEFALRVARQLMVSRMLFMILFAIISLIFVAIEHANGIRDGILLTWPIVVICILYYIFYWRDGRLSFNFTVFVLLIFSLFSAHSLSKFTSSKELNNRLVLAEKKLATDEDPLIEINYSDLEPDLLKSELLNNAFETESDFSKTKFEENLLKEYFSGDWDNFEIQFYLFSKDSLPIGLEGFAPVREFVELDNIILQNGVSTKFSPNLYFIYNSYNKLSYVIKLPVRLRDDDPKGFLFCELRSKKIPEDIGFPELLMDKNSNKIEFIHQYSYARYVDQLQVNRFGSFRYSLNSTPYQNFSGKYTMRYENGYDHLIYKVDDRTLLILSRATEKFINKATTFSYLFTLFCLILIVGFLGKQISKGYASIHLTLQGKVQFLLVGVLLISLVLFGLGTRYFIADQYREKNYNIISEKIQSVRIEVMHKLGRETELNDDLKNYIGYILSKLSNVFLTDINLYDDKGKLIATSRPKIFQSGLLTSQMNPGAYVQMKNENKSEFIQEEKIGEMHFLSAYVPLLNDRNQVLGYLNLPYFAKQSSLETELSSFLVAILNIFVVLFALSILAALFVSNWITKPLRYVQQSLASIQLGKTNKPIEYKGRDEIGSLVEEYNKKVAELEKYAQELARSERESAWREMAKQVAHEIKNPLTPMRLSIQHMQRSLRPGDVDWEQKLNKFTTTIIEQIDALTHIANEFSHFAKMPKAQEEILDVMQILENTVELYKESPNINLNLHRGELRELFVYADKDQLLRVFNNLIKNAIQAIPDEREGKIDISAKKNAEMYVIEIKDNGSGIAPERIDKIFMPNFTTKSTGMGLGLAMVKNIVENAGGKVWFETTQNIGTKFYVSLPVHRKTI